MSPRSLVEWAADVAVGVFSLLSGYFRHPWRDR